MGRVSLRERLNNYVKILPPCEWNWKAIYILILILFGYGYFAERSSRIQKESVIKELVIIHDAELGDHVDFINGMVLRQMRIENELHHSRSVLMDMRRTIYEMYNELRKYKKDLPPWGGEKPLEPADPDKWI